MTQGLWGVSAGRKKINRCQDMLICSIKLNKTSQGERLHAHVGLSLIFMIIKKKLVVCLISLEN